MKSSLLNSPVASGAQPRAASHGSFGMLSVCARHPLISPLCAAVKSSMIVSRSSSVIHRPVFAQRIRIAPPERAYQLRGIAELGDEGLDIAAGHLVTSIVGYHRFTNSSGSSANRRQSSIE
jgi:hypothetical protein